MNPKTIITIGRAIPPPQPIKMMISSLTNHPIAASAGM
jgi:hypothetical protein